mgnify:CR=1 FL=1
MYLGEADSVYWRLKEHDKEKDFCTRAVTITSKDMNLTKAHGRYRTSTVGDFGFTFGYSLLCNGSCDPPLVCYPLRTTISCGSA